MLIGKIEIDYYNPYEGLLKGYYYAAEFFNGAAFDFWSSNKLNHKQARQAALKIANGDYGPIYLETDIVSVRKSS